MHDIAFNNLWPVGPLFVGPLFGRTCWTCLNPPLLKTGLKAQKIRQNDAYTHCQYLLALAVTLQMMKWQDATETVYLFDKVRQLDLSAEKNITNVQHDKLIEPTAGFIDEVLLFCNYCWCYWKPILKVIKKLSGLQSNTFETSALLMNYISANELEFKSVQSV